MSDDRSDGDGLRPAMADLAHVVHNASNLVLGHVAAMQRGTDDPERVAERARVIESALGRITGVVDALRASLDPASWGPAQQLPIHDVLQHACDLVETESCRRGIRLERTVVLDVADDPCAVDGRRASAMVAALLGAGLERLGSNGSISITASGTGADAARIDLVAERDDGLALHHDGATSVWVWIAARIGEQFAATLAEPDAATCSITVPIRSGGPAGLAAPDPRLSSPG